MVVMKDEMDLIQKKRGDFAQLCCKENTVHVKQNKKTVGVIQQHAPQLVVQCSAFESWGASWIM